MSDRTIYVFPKDRGFAVAIVASAVDEHGNTMLTLRMPGAPVHSIELAGRKAFTAVIAKMARVVHAVVKAGADYRPFVERPVPGGGTPPYRSRGGENETEKEKA